jgi:hypothetical protein
MVILLMMWFRFLIFGLGPFDEGQAERLSVSFSVLVYEWC